MANDVKFVDKYAGALKWVDAGYFLAIAAWVALRAPRNLRYWVGMSVAAIGFVLWMVVRQQLGKSFSVTAQARKLVTTGLYSKIRNPIYFFAGVSFLGVFVALGNNYWLVGFLLFYFAFQFGRMRKESIVLEQAFGDEYRRYKAQTWF